MVYIYENPSLYMPVKIKHLKLINSNGTYINMEMPVKIQLKVIKSNAI